MINAFLVSFQSGLGFELVEANWCSLAENLELENKMFSKN